MNNEPLTWKERFITAIGIAVMFLTFVYFFGLSIERTGDRAEEREQCLKKATDGYQAQLCR